MRFLIADIYPRHYRREKKREKLVTKMEIFNIMVHKK